MKNLQAIIFDLNGILIKSMKLSDRFRDEYGVGEEKFLPVLKKIMPKVRMPNAPACYDLWKPYLEQWGVDMDKTEFYRYWFGAEGENKELLEFLKDFKKENPDVRLFVLSNNFTERAKYYKENFPWLHDSLENLFEKVYYSWQTGFVKPDIRAFELIINENNLVPEKCIYFDDSPRNIEVAGTLGINGYCTDKTEKIMEIINQMLSNESI